MSILCSHNCVVTRLIVFRISALCFQRQHLNGLRVIHRRDECSSVIALYYTSISVKITRIPRVPRRRHTSSHGIYFCGFN